MNELISNWKSCSLPFWVQGKQCLSYSDLYLDVEKCVRDLQRQPRAALAFLAENKYEFYVKLIAAFASGKVVLLLPKYQFDDDAFRAWVHGETATQFGFDATATVGAHHPLIGKLAQQAKAGFIIRTSGSSSARFKLILHDVDQFLSKYRRRGKHFEKTMAFSPADSIAGVETLLECLVHRAVLAGPPERLCPESVAEFLGDQKVDYFQTTPTFLNLLLLSKCLEPSKLPLLRSIAFGSEPSAKKMLEALRQKLPKVQLCHTYGMSEIGIQITRTNPLDPSTFALDESFNPGRIRDGRLEVSSLTPMVGYLNRAGADGTLPDYFPTNDQVEMEGDYLRVLGRDSDVVNVAGHKFFPFEVEEILLQCPQIADVTVCVKKSDWTGQVLLIKVLPVTFDDERLLRLCIKSFCERRLPTFMHPQSVEILDAQQFNDRYKKMRRI